MNKLKTLLLTTVFVGFTSVSFACDVTSTVGTPQTSIVGLIELCHAGYQSLFDPTIKDPRVVSEHLLGANLLVGAEDRNCTFKVDPLLPKGVSATAKDYASNGHDWAKGHMAPYHDFAKDQTQGTDSCLFSNAVPQVQTCNNAGIWSAIEKYVEGIAARDGEVYIATGPIFDDSAPVVTMGNGVRVPDYLFKVIYNPKLNQSLTFLVPNVSQCGAHPASYIVNQNEVENKAGITLFPEVSGYGIATKLW